MFSRPFLPSKPLSVPYQLRSSKRQTAKYKQPGRPQPQSVSSCGLVGKAEARRDPSSLLRIAPWLAQSICALYCSTIDISLSASVSNAVGAFTRFSLPPRASWVVRSVCIPLISSSIRTSRRHCQSGAALYVIPRPLDRTVLAARPSCHTGIVDWRASQRKDGHCPAL